MAQSYDEANYFWTIAAAYRAAKRNGSAADQAQYLNELCDLYVLAESAGIAEKCRLLVAAEGQQQLLATVVAQHHSPCLLREATDKRPTLTLVDEASCVS